MNYHKFEQIGMKGHQILTERWVQDRIAQDPGIVGLGDVILKDKERIQPRAGRLDLLFQDADGNRRYEVEVQLGSTDESHIIRTLEYWDIERKRYPQYEHTAVIIAEHITSRFLNVISMFNGTIPLVAIQMRALQVDDKVGLVFTKVLDQMSLGLVDDDEGVSEVTDRSYWEDRATKKTVAMADKLLEIVREHDGSLELKYNKFYIGLAKDGNPFNFVTFRPKKNFVRVEPRLPESDEIKEKLDNSGLDLMEYDGKWGRYRVNINTGDLEKFREVLRDLISAAYDHAKGD